MISSCSVWLDGKPAYCKLPMISESKHLVWKVLGESYRTNSMKQKEREKEYSLKKRKTYQQKVKVFSCCVPPMKKSGTDDKTKKYQQAEIIKYNQSQLTVFLDVRLTWQSVVYYLCYLLY